MTEMLMGYIVPIIVIGAIILMPFMAWDMANGSKKWISVFAF